MKEKVKKYKRDLDCNLCGETLVFSNIINCSPFYIIKVFGKDKAICKHCYRRLKEQNHETK